MKRSTASTEVNLAPGVQNVSSGSFGRSAHRQIVARLSFFPGIRLGRYFGTSRNAITRSCSRSITRSSCCMSIVVMVRPEIARSVPLVLKHDTGSCAPACKINVDLRSTSMLISALKSQRMDRMCSGGEPASARSTYIRIIGPALNPGESASLDGIHWNRNHVTLDCALCTDSAFRDRNASVHPMLLVDLIPPSYRATLLPTMPPGRYQVEVIGSSRRRQKTGMSSRPREQNPQSSR